MYVHVCVMRQCLISLSRLALYMVALKYTITYLLTIYIYMRNITGIEGISVKLLKYFAPVITNPLTLIINQSLTMGIFPSKLKIAKVLPLLKKNDPYIMDNYRPISLLTTISKLFEKVAFNQLFEYFHKNNLFYDSQYGFRRLHSTELAAMELTDKVLVDIDEKIFHSRSLWILARPLIPWIMIYC